MDLNREKLYRLYSEEGKTQKELAKKFGVSQSWISRKMDEFGLETRTARKWTRSEENILKEKYGCSSREDLEEIFSDRSWNAIKLKAMNLGLAVPAEDYRHSREVKERLKKNSKELEIEVDFSQKEVLSYVLGVIDGDGFHDKVRSIGLEVTNADFAKKFEESLEALGLNPGTGTRRGKETVWASSVRLVEWIKRMQSGERHNWLLDEGNPWKYFEGRYESDGNIHPSGSPRVCSYDEDEKEFMASLFKDIGVKCSIQQNNVWVSAKSKDLFFDRINPVLRRP